MARVLFFAFLILFFSAGSELTVNYFLTVAIIAVVLSITSYGMEDVIARRSKK